MTPKEIQHQVELAVQQSLHGQEIENPKVDCKSKWYQFGDEPELYAFLKDCTSIANTVGLDGFIIIGYNDKEKTRYNTRFPDSGLRDSSDLYNILIKHVDEPCDIAVYPVKIESTYLNVIHIPPALHKPHVIRLFKYFKNGVFQREEKHRIFVRKNTGTFEANKYDLDLMYYDRKNIIPEYEINVWLNVNHLSLAPQCSDGKCKLVKGSIPVTIENSGRRSVSINILTMTISLFEDPAPDETLQARSLPGSMVGENFILKPQDIKHYNLSFESHSFNGHYCAEVQSSLQEFETNRRRVLITDFVLHSTHERALIPKITLTH
jgi:hypothetical protein